MNILYKTLIYGGNVSLSVLQTTDLVNRGIAIHGLRPAAGRTFGSLLTCGAYMAGCLKSERGAISITIKGANGSGSASVSGDVNLHMRGYIDDGAEGRLEGGFMTVIKDDGFFRPYTGACELISDDVSRNMEHYFELSEQIVTRVSVGADVGKDGVCRAAGGVVMQLLPGHSEEDKRAVYKKMEQFGNPAAIIAEMGAEGLMKKYFSAETEGGHIYMTSPDYICNCSREKISAVLVSLGREELERIIAEQGCVSVHCHYCNSDYKFGTEDIEEIFR